MGRQLLHDGCIDKLSLVTDRERPSEILSLFLRSKRDGLVRRVRLGGVLVVRVLVVWVLVVI